MSVFTYVPDFGSTKSSKPVVSTVKFGDGYEQRFARGINTLENMWSLRFENRDVADIDAIEAFFVARAGVEAFEWTPLRESDPVTVKCTEWNRTTEHGVTDSISCTFVRVYEP